MPNRQIMLLVAMSTATILQAWHRLMITVPSWTSAQFRCQGSSSS
jgi:hypothetical protein